MKINKGHLIAAVEAGSAAEELEIEAGDRPPRKGTPAAPAASRPEAGEYDRMRDYMNKLNGGGNHGP